MTASSVGVVGQHLQGIDAACEICLIDRRRRRRCRPDRRVEHRQTARIDGVEARIRAVGIVDDVAEVAVVVDLDSDIRSRSQSCLLNMFRPSLGCRPGAGRPGRCRSVPGRGSAPSARSVRSPAAGSGRCSSEQRPPFRYRQDRLALFPLIPATTRRAPTCASSVVRSRRRAVISATTACVSGHG